MALVQNKLQAMKLTSLWTNIHRAPAALTLACIIGFLPLINGLFMRGYRFPLQPEFLHQIREFEFLYLVAEIGIMFWALRKGMSLKTEFSRLGRSTRYALLVFLVLFPISSFFFAPVPFYSIIRASYWVFHIGCAFAISFLLTAITDDLVKQTVEIFVAGFLAISLLLGLHFYNAPWPHHIFVEKYNWTSIAPGFLSVRQFGMISGLVLAAWLGSILSGHRSKSGALLSLVISASLFGILFWSGTRSAMLAVGVTMPVVILFGRRMPAIRSIAMLILAAFIGAALSTIWIPPGNSFGILVASKFSINGSTDLSSGRIDLWIEGWRMFTESPILGWGEGSFFALLAMAGKGYHLQPHNFILQFLVSWGAIAGGIAMFMMARAMLRLHLGLHRAYGMLVAVAALDSILIMAMLDGALFTLRTILPAILFWIMAEKIYAQHAASQN
jgi:O-antigen ligase